MSSSRVKITALLAVLGLLVFSLHVAPPAAAQEEGRSVGLGVDKNTFDVDVFAGGEYSDAVVVFNNSQDAALPVGVELSLWDLNETTDDYEFVVAEETLNATRWFTVTPSDLILEPDEAAPVEFSIRPPEDTPPGSYLVMMRFQPVLPDFYFTEEGPRFVPEIGTLFFIRVPLLSLDGTQNLYGAEIASIEPEGESIALAGNVLPRAQAGVFDDAVERLIAKMRNTGIYHFKAAGTLEIKNIFGRTVESIDLPPRYLLPNKTRPIPITILTPPETEKLPIYKKILLSTYYLLRTNLYFGPYSATITLSVPDGLPVVATTNFWIIPWKFWLIAALITAGVILFVRRFGGRVRRAFRVLTSRKTKKWG